MAALTGDNNVVNSEFEVELDYEEALVLSAFIDLHRLAVLRSCANEEDYTFPALSADAIIARVQATGSRPQALTGIIRSIKGPPEDPSPEQAAVCLESLVQRDILSQDNGGYLPGDELKRLAGNLLIFQGMIHLDAGRTDDEGRLEMLETLFIQAGLHDILRVDPGGGSVTMEAVSSAVLLGYVRTMLTTPPLTEGVGTVETA